MPRTKVHVPEGMYEVIGEPYNKDLFIVAVPAIDVARAQGMSSSYITETQMMQRKMNEDHQRKMDIESGGPIRPRTAIVDDMEDKSKKIDKAEFAKQMWEEYSTPFAEKMREMSSKPIKMDDLMDAMINQMTIPADWVSDEVKETPRERDDRIIDGG